ncbi:MAG: hypothetical protein HGA39_06140 [Coriobacteriia bacterium]|nr:hypothetical protein [Coriobacteriia bacterium]
MTLLLNQIATTDKEKQIAAKTTRLTTAALRRFWSVDLLGPVISAPLLGYDLQNT